MIISDFCINDSYEQRKMDGFSTGKDVLPVATEVLLRSLHELVPDAALLPIIVPNTGCAVRAWERAAREQTLSASISLR